MKKYFTKNSIAVMAASFLLTLAIVITLGEKGRAAIISECDEVYAQSLLTAYASYTETAERMRELREGGGAYDAELGALSAAQTERLKWMTERYRRIDDKLLVSPEVVRLITPLHEARYPGAK